ncbi:MULTISPECIES: hypothetical protein [unclassified Streptomyces]|uniref:hypothetical protein n=1 Tax=unclassified Streptomyces TaxID=2593676 RepID=UPI00017E8557|nr:MULTISPECIES: hypothetical protein [unclassified Streptomyces]AKL64402.1 HSP18 transcriptional regulator [Streptomyces sp. Mg1]EDX20478.1 hsp18 transcriptional regulator [Streptomyces sp. Mg1]RPK43093.1 hypothetical protein EES37_17655 [Streptomyces sp. ADI91-18]
MNEASQAAAPVPSPAAATALRAIDQAVRHAQRSSVGTPRTESADAGPHPALAALLMLREVREQLAGWESGLIETAREQGASWAELAGPLGVASRQAAERRYLRLRPGAAGSTGEERVQATRAADRNVTAWARDNAADLRRLAGQITALTDLPDAAAAAVGELNRALANNDAARLVRPLTDTRAHLRPQDRALVDHLDAMTRHTDHLSRDSHDRRGT